MATALRTALENNIWVNHTIGDTYTMDNKPELWKIAYYPIFEDGKTGEVYKEPRALIERPAIFNGEQGIDFREVPLRYLLKKQTNMTALQELIENCKTAKENSKDGYVTYDEVIEVAETYLKSERHQLEDTWDAGYKKGFSEGGDIDNLTNHPDRTQWLNGLTRE